MEILDIYLLNLAVTIGMFIILIVRAWLEWKNYRIIWADIRRNQKLDTLAQLLKAEKSFFLKVEGGKKLYEALCDIFEIEEQQNSL
jgi:hypothetical protein